MADVNTALQTEIAERKRAEQALRDSEALYHSLVESLPLNVFRKDMEGRFTFGNTLFARALGVSPEQLVGKTDFDFFPAELAEKYRQDDLRVIATGEVFEDVEAHRAPTGELRYVQVLKTIVRDARGANVGTQGLFWDITARKQAEEGLRISEERYMLAVRGSCDGLWDWNVLTNEVYYSPRMKEMLGYRNDEFENVFASFESHLHPDDHDRVLKALSAHIARRIPYDVEYRIRAKYGDYRWFHARGQALWDEAGNATRMAGSVSDVTEQKRAERRPIAQYTVTHVLADAATLREAAAPILQAVCDSAGWEVGVIWSVDEAAKLLRCVDVWCMPGIETAAAEFAQATRETTFAPGIGLPGRVWSRRAPRWIPDVLRDTQAARTAFAAQAGLHGAFAFPILFGSEVTGVIEFYCKEIREPEEDLIAMLDALGSQIGQFTARRRAEQQLQAALETAEAARRARSAPVTGDQ